MAGSHRFAADHQESDYPTEWKGRFVPNYGYLDAHGVGVPTASATGYAPGCRYVRLDGAADTVTYTNEGDKDAATWVAETT